MTNEVSRRKILNTGGALLGGIFSMGSGRSASTDTGITGWITKGSKADIAGVDGTVQSFRHVGSSLCNDGNIFACRTCTGVEFFLLVPARSRSPTVGETYQFRPTGAENFCGNFRVRLLEAGSCGHSTPTTGEHQTGTATETTTETATKTTETTTETTSTQTTPEPTTETTTATTETTTETGTTTETTPEAATEEDAADTETTADE